MATTSLRGAHLSLQQDRLWSFQQGSRFIECMLRDVLPATLFSGISEMQLDIIASEIGIV
jgi:hypothetical protein